MRMDPPPPDFRLLRFSSDTLPEHQRLPAWREILSRKLLGLDVEQLQPEPFHAKVMMRAQHGLFTGTGTIAASVSRRTKAMVAADNDDLALFINTDGEVVASPRMNPVAMRANDAILISCNDVGEYQWRLPTKVMLIRMPRAALAPLVPSLDDAVAQLIPRETDLLRLLTNYISTLYDDGDFAMTPGASHVVVDHIFDLAALSIGAARNPASLTADGHSRHAARLRVVKSDIVRNLNRLDLRVDMVAANQRLSPRNIQRLFESDGTTFTAYVLEQRLARAWRILSDPRFADRNISVVAYESGFGDISYFNRSFRKRFGASPTEVRRGP
jgi:AraC-like DNA-binding protein